ncbi:hypothetical protein [Streptomyces sp. NPDC007172]|uniref:hypothetical protein n=1 Tax=Streptomyces sp. NPDC007172 TaxID=3364776 RepID=UPI0036C5F19C
MWWVAGVWWARGAWWARAEGSVVAGPEWQRPPIAGFIRPAAVAVSPQAWTGASTGAPAEFPVSTPGEPLVTELAWPAAP